MPEAIYTPWHPTPRFQDTSANFNTEQSQDCWGRQQPKPLRVQVPNNHILTQKLYYNYYYPRLKCLIIGYLDPLGTLLKPGFGAVGRVGFGGSDLGVCLR